MRNLHECIMFMRIIAACGGWLLALTTASAAPPVESVEMLIHHWTTRDGMPNNRVRTVTRTSDGFIWLATDGGAVRFDGLNFRVFGLREGLLAPIVLDIRETPDKRLWFATLGGGLSVYRNGGIESTYTTADGLPSNWVTGIEVDAAGTLLAITRSGAARFDRRRFIPLPKIGPPPYAARSIVKDGSGTFWGIVGNRLLCTWKDAAWKPLDPGGPEQTDAITIDLQGRLWAAGAGTLWLHDAGTWTPHPLPEHFQKRVSSIAASGDGTVWLAFHRHGLCGFKDGRFFSPKPEADFTHDRVENVVATTDRQLWVTSANGFYRLFPSRIRSVLLEDPAAPSAANILGGIVEVAPEEFIVATQGSGFYRWQGGKISRLNDDPDLGAGVYGNVILKTDDDSLWLGSSKGLHEMKPDGVIRKHALPGTRQDEVWSLASDPDGLWIGTNFGRLHRLADGNIQTVDYGGDREPIKAFARDADGSLWVGSRGNGLYRRKDDRWERFDRNSGLFSNIIRVLYLDPQGRLWVGSDGGGLALWLGNGRFISVTAEEGLPNNTVSQILLDPHGRLWVGTHRGLAVFDPSAVADIAAGRLDALHPLLINESDGMPADELTIVPPLPTHDGTTAFATTRGFFRLDMKDFQAEPTRPPVYIEEIRANGNRINFTPKQIVLPPGTDRLEVSFTALNFHDPGRLKFRSRLAGLDDGWILLDKRRGVEYRNLKPGTYQFQAEATAGNGLWSATPAVVDITIAPQFWQTSGFQIAITLASFGMVAALVWGFERRRARRKIEIFKRRQAVDAERARIARDLHDDLGASLTQMALQSQLAERHVTRQPERAISHLQEVFKTASRMTRTLDEIIWAVNPKHDTLENFVLFLASHAQDVAESAGLRCRIDVPDSIPARMMPSNIRHHLYLAAKEVLHNIVKHANATEIILRITLDDSACVILIGDDGVGFEGGALPIDADGLLNMRERLEKIHGTCTRQSTPGQGTSVEMRVPMKWSGAAN